MSKICAVCGNETTIANRLKLADNGFICSTCFKACRYSLATPINKISVEEARRAFKEEEQDSFDEEGQERALHELKGLGNTLFIYKNRIVISYPDADSEEKTIQFSDIISIHYHKAGILKGYIQLFWPRVNKTLGDRGTHREEISIEFSHDQNDEAEKIYAYVTRSFRDVKKSPGLPVSLI